MNRGAAVVVFVFVLACVPWLGGEWRAVGADVGTVMMRPSYAEAWRSLGGADYEGFMDFCRQRIPRSGAVVSIVEQPSFGYYRATYDLYPRTVWPIVSWLGPHADDRPIITRVLLRQVLIRTGARYLAVWHVSLPRPLPASRWVATFAPGEYLIALR